MKIMGVVPIADELRENQLRRYGYGQGAREARSESLLVQVDRVEVNSNKWPVGRPERR